MDEHVEVLVRQDDTESTTTFPEEFSVAHFNHHGEPRSVIHLYMLEKVPKEYIRGCSTQIIVDNHDVDIPLGRRSYRAIWKWRPSEVGQTWANQVPIDLVAYLPWWIREIFGRR